MVIAHSVGCSGVVLSLVEEARANGGKVNVDALMFVDPVLGPAVTGGPSVRLSALNPKTEASAKPKTMCVSHALLAAVLSTDV